MPTPLQVLCVTSDAPDLSTSPFGPFIVEACDSLARASLLLGQQPYDAVLVMLAPDEPLEALLRWPDLPQTVVESALLVVAREPAAPPALRLVQLGVQDVLADGDAGHVGRALRLAVERRQIELATRKAYATDLATGLPNHAQLLEHMTHLLALREREPAPMALIALRIDGLAATEATLGAEAANVLRRKVAVRLRAGLRASDVVASIGADAFAVLLAWIDSATDGERVMNKLARSLREPFSVTTQPVSVSVSAGLALYPDHGKEAGPLLRRAAGQAASTVTTGRASLAQRLDRRAEPAAANDDEA
jgi:diguanylate cyclase (GGDEF)-like protein